MGIAGKRHLQAQLHLGIKTGIYTHNPATIYQFKKHPNIIVFDTLQEAMSWSNLVHVCTPDDTHSEYIALAMKQSKAVLSEKPLTTKLQDALELQKLSQEYKAPLIVGQNYRLTPTFLETKNQVSQGKLGTITTIETTYLHDMTEYRLGEKWRNIQDFLYVGGSHAIDLAFWVIGEKVINVQAAIGKKIRTEYNCEERYQIILTFASGILGHVTLDSSSARLIHGSNVIVTGEKGQLSSHMKKNKLIWFKKGDKNVKSITVPNIQTRTIALEIKIVNDYLLGKTSSYQPLPDIHEAVHVIKILDTIKRAISSGKKESV